MLKLNSLSLDEGALMAALKTYIVGAFKQAEDQLLDLMEKEVLRTVVGGGPGKPAWRAKAKEMLMVIEEQIADSYLEAKIGIDPGASFIDFVRTMLISEGAGSAAGGPPIHAGPLGRSVWNSGMSGQKPSASLTEYQLPGGFNQPGNHFVENAMKLMEKHYSDIQAELAASIPDSVFSSAVIVSAG